MIRHGMMRNPGLLALLVLGAAGPEPAPAPAPTRKPGERPEPAPAPGDVVVTPGKDGLVHLGEDRAPATVALAEDVDDRLAALQNALETHGAGGP